MGAEAFRPLTRQEDITMDTNPGTTALAGAASPERFDPAPTVGGSTSPARQAPRLDPHRYTRPGTVLHNGARIVAYRPRRPGDGVVLALTQGMASHTYATWVINPVQGATFSGHYTDDFADAVADFNDR